MKKTKILSFALALITLMSCFVIVIPASAATDGYKTPPSDMYDENKIIYSFDGKYYCYSFDEACVFTLTDGILQRSLKEGCAEYYYIQYEWMTDTQTWYTPSSSSSGIKSTSTFTVNYDEIIYSSVELNGETITPPDEPETPDNSCGEDLTYSLDESTGIFTVSGTGLMTDYDGSSSPWYDLRASIKTVVIEDGVESIGDYAFYNSTVLTKVIVKDRLSFKSIGFKAFYYCTNLITLVYCGTESEWEAVEKGDNWDTKTSVSVQYHDYVDGMCTACGDIEPEAPEDYPSAPSDTLSGKLVYSYGDKYYCISFDEACEFALQDGELIRSLKDGYESYRFIIYEWIPASEFWSADSVAGETSTETVTIAHDEIISSTVDVEEKEPAAPDEPDDPTEEGYKVPPEDGLENKLIYVFEGMYRCVSFDLACTVTYYNGWLTFSLKDSYASFTYEVYTWDFASETWTGNSDDTVDTSEGSFNFAYDDLISSTVEVEEKEPEAEEDHPSAPTDTLSGKLVYTYEGNYYCISFTEGCGLALVDGDLIRFMKPGYQNYRFITYEWIPSSQLWNPDSVAGETSTETVTIAHDEILSHTVDIVDEVPNPADGYLTPPVYGFEHNVIYSYQGDYYCTSYSASCVASLRKGTIKFSPKDTFYFMFIHFVWDPDANVWVNGSVDGDWDYVQSYITEVMAYDEIIYSTETLTEEEDDSEATEFGYFNPPSDDLKNKVICLLNGNYTCVSFDDNCAVVIENGQLKLSLLTSKASYSYVDYTWDLEHNTWLSSAIKFDNEYFVTDQPLVYNYDKIVYSNVDSVEAELFPDEFSSVLEDLQKDPNFKVADYPINLQDYSLKVIQIAEGKNGELYVYVYNPSRSNKGYEAKYINMSLDCPVDENGSYKKEGITNKLYKLVLVSTEGTIDKYVVWEYTVPDKAERYYNIAAIYRPFDEDVDDVSSAVDSIQCRAYGVGQYWRAYNKNGSVAYENKKIDVVTITIQATGSVRYYNGIKYFNYSSSSDSHYVAFSIDNYKADQIIDADITYLVNRYQHIVDDFGEEDETTLINTIPKDTYFISNKDTGSNDGGGWFGKKYTWKRIQTVDDFLKEVEEDSNTTFNEKELEDLKNAQFVFRFLETDYWSSAVDFYIEHYSKAEEIGILRLHFISDGQHYNLGVVGDLTGTDQDPEQNVTGGDNVQNNFEDWLKKLEEKMGKLAEIIGILIAVVAIVAVIAVCTPVLSIVGKGFAALFGFIGSLITAPFRAISKSNKPRKRK